MCRKPAVCSGDTLGGQELLVPSNEGFALVDGVDSGRLISMMEMWNDRYRRLIERFKKRMYALEMGAAIGHQVSPEEWNKAMSTAKIEHCSELMQELQRDRLIVVQAETGWWSFEHTLFREAILLHAKAKGRLERWFRILVTVVEPTMSNALRRARYMVHAGNPQDALRPLCRAALIASNKHEFGNAKRLCGLRSGILRRWRLTQRAFMRLILPCCSFLKPLAEQATILKCGGFGY